jgi:hypothetical protein
LVWQVLVIGLQFWPDEQELQAMVWPVHRLMMEVPQLLGWHTSGMQQVPVAGPLVKMTPASE